jgi:carbamoyltransferase
MSKIYGFYGGSHSASASLLIDGKPIYCIEEERMTRQKTGDVPVSWPEESYYKINQLTDVSVENSDYNIFVKPIADKWTERFSKGRWETVDHHVAHNYGAYFTSGMEGKVLAVSYDGGGDESFMRVYLCEGSKMTQVHQLFIHSHGSLSHLWGFSTMAMMGYDEYWAGNWKICKDEGKLMGMAPEGMFDPKLYQYFKSIIRYDNLVFYPALTAFKTKLVADFLLFKGYFDIPENRERYSYNLQLYTEDLMINFFNDLHQKFPEYNKVVVSGGLFANVKMNQKINELPWLEELYVYPPMGDEGLSLGACLWKGVQLGEITKPLKLSNVSLGPSYDENEVRNIIDSNDYDFEITEYNPTEVAKDIHEGLIIGWFQGGMEYGPRALGNRSILVRPTEYETHQKLNERLGRYDTMPFAPMVLSEHFDDIFTSNKSMYSSQFMTICYTTKDEWIDRIPAVIQKSDKTARPQVVSKTNNEEVYHLMERYREISSIPVILNTSFNIHGEPIIESPIHAFEHLKNKVVDKLVIGKYVYQNK